MGRISFVLLTFPLLHALAVGEVYGQDNDTSAVAAPSMQATEPGSTDTAPFQSPDITSEIKEEAATPKQSKTFLEEFFSSPINYMALLIVCLYIYLVFMQPRGAGRERKEQLERLNNLKKNDRVVTTSGIHGIVSNINADNGTVTLRVDENTNSKLTVDRNAIRTVVS